MVFVFVFGDGQCLAYVWWIVTFIYLIDKANLKPVPVARLIIGPYGGKKCML